jgi:hypothetical protein
MPTADRSAGPSPISVTLPDGKTRELPAGSTGADLAAAIGPRLAQAAIAVVVNGAERDLGSVLPGGAAVSVVTGASEAGRAILRHSTSHVMAQAVTRLWPGARYAIGPSIEDGFYYDFELPSGAHFSEDDLARIEATMREIISEDQEFVREEHSASTFLRTSPISAKLSREPGRHRKRQRARPATGSRPKAREPVPAGLAPTVTSAR